MITSILNDCLLLKNEPADKLQGYLHSINLTIFDPIFHNSQSTEEAKQKILYLLCAYSEDSPLLILRQDSKEEKEGICEYLQIPDFMRKNLMELTDREVRLATTQYLIQFAGQLFKALKLIDIQLEDLNLAITNREYMTKENKSKKEGKPDEIIFFYDTKEHTKAVFQYELLSKKRTALEKEIRNQGTYKAINELKEFKFQFIDKKINAVKDGVCMENARRIKIGMHG